LGNNPYPGRGIIIGCSPDAKNFIQVYWIMGRSENSRNRIFINEKGIIKTKPYDDSKVKDPSLIIYNVMKSLNSTHIVTNGDQTDTIYAEIQNGHPFEKSLDTRTFEPDEPNFTPRISGITSLDSKYAYQLSILKTIQNDPEYGIKQFFSYEKGIPGYGHCIHTYKNDGNPLPAFEGEPYLVELYNDIDATAHAYWNMLNTENKISLVVKCIDKESGNVTIKIINKHS